MVRFTRLQTRVLLMPQPEELLEQRAVVIGRRNPRGVYAVGRLGPKRRFRL